MTHHDQSRRTIARGARSRSGLLRAGAVALGLAALPAAASDWPTAEPEAAGFAPDLAERLDAALDGPTGAGLHAVLVVRGGQLVYERYLAGDDEIWGRPKAGVVFGPDMLHDLRSITKSVVSLLYGIALGDGAVPAPEVPVLEALPAYADLAADPMRAAITVHDVLAMTMGTEWNEDLPYNDPANSEIAMNRAPDSLRYVLDRPMAAEPGTAWTYNGGATELLGGLIAQGTGGDLIAFARERLFEPLGIARFEWITDYYGQPHAASALRLRPRDTARLGQLVLQGGVWEGRQVVPAAWIDRATSEQSEGGFGCRFGYQWWLCSTADGTPVIDATGYGGQALLIVPAHDLVTVVNAGLYGDESAFERGYALLEGSVLPALVAP
jgi:CubicO group peptidase (beta-lactamase class C family)